MNYFEFYGLKPSFFLDEKKLKKQYIRKSRALHPDFHMDGDESKIQGMLELSSFNNKAYEILKDFYLRARYIVDTYLEETSTKLEPSFLMDMMDMNEDVMELSMDFQEEKANKMILDLELEEKSMLDKIIPQLELFDHQRVDESILKEAEQFLLKRNYLLRIKENLNKFAAT